MKNTLTHLEASIKEILKKKITIQVLKRMVIVMLYLLEFKVKEISSVLKCSEKNVYQTIKKFKSYGILNISEKPRSGRKSFLNQGDVLELKDKINSLNSQDSQRKVIHIEIVNDIINKNKGRKFSRSGIYSFCKKKGIRKIKPRPIHVKNDPEVIEVWKKEFPKIIDKVKKEHPDKKILLYYQDESRFGQKTITSGIWSPCGIRPEYKNQNGFLNSWIYGAINIESGKRHGLVLPTLDSENMQIFLNSFSRTIKRNEHILLILDGSRAHDNKKIIIPKNIALHFLPPYSPQLNPIERLWSFLKRNYLSFKLYENLDEIIHAGSEAWNQLSDEIVKSIGFSQTKKRCLEHI